jgi:hypothetical protein
MPPDTDHNTTVEDILGKDVVETIVDDTVARHALKQSLE